MVVWTVQTSALALINYQTGRSGVRTHENKEVTGVWFPPFAMVAPRRVDGDQTPGPREQSARNFSSHGEREESCGGSEWR